MSAVPNETALRLLASNHSLLATLPVRSVIVTEARGYPRFDFLARFYAPAVGVHKGPVTGSAHYAERRGVPGGDRSRRDHITTRR
jgi:predicted PhzF superfamily epimerase YddE/YHI9